MIITKKQNLNKSYNQKKKLLKNDDNLKKIETHETRAWSSARALALGHVGFSSFGSGISGLETYNAESQKGRVPKATNGCNRYARALERSCSRCRRARDKKVVFVIQLIYICIYIRWGGGGGEKRIYPLAGCASVCAGLSIGRSRCSSFYLPSFIEKPSPGSGRSTYTLRAPGY